MAEGGKVGFGAWPFNLINIDHGFLIVGFPVPLVARHLAAN